MNTATQTNSKQGAYVQANDLNMYYETHGSGIPVVLLHDGLETARCGRRSRPHSPGITRSLPQTAAGMAGRITHRVSAATL